MNKYNKQGKIFFIVTIILSIAAICASLKGYTRIKFTGGEWFVLLGTLFCSSINLFHNIKEKKIYYTVGTSIIIFTGVIFYLIPQLIMII